MSQNEDLTIPFQALGFDGQVDVEQWLNDDPARTGHDLVAVGYDGQRFRSFPVVTAEVRYSGDGYRAIFGWIQAVTHEYAVPEDGTSTTIDAWPGLGAPLIALGYKPTFFDAPANPDHPDMRWVAHTFLVRVDLRERKLAAIAGFAWGYELANHRPTAHKPSPASRADWDRVTTAQDALSDWELTCEIQVEA